MNSKVKNLKNTVKTNDVTIIKSKYKIKARGFTKVALLIKYLLYYNSHSTMIDFIQKSLKNKRTFNATSLN